MRIYPFFVTCVFERALILEDPNNLSLSGFGDFFRNFSRSLVEKLMLLVRGGRVLISALEGKKNIPVNSCKIMHKSVSRIETLKLNDNRQEKSPWISATTQKDRAEFF